MAFTSDIFKTFVGPDGARVGIEIWISADAESAMLEIAEFSETGEDIGQVTIKLDLEDLTKIKGAFEEAMWQIGGKP